MIVLEKPFRNYYAKAERMRSDWYKPTVILLELRLDMRIIPFQDTQEKQVYEQIVDHLNI